MNDDTAAREALIAAARRLNRSGINQGKSGNLSTRCEGGFLVTPTSLPYENLVPGDISFVHSDGSAAGPRAPSSEWRFHFDIYARRPEANAVVHCHSPFATTLACLHRSIPAFHYEVTLAGGDDIRCAPYATFGTQELSDHALAALEGRRACLLANHGQIAFGRDLETAFVLAEKVEALARMYWQALQLGEPAILDGAEMERVRIQYHRYSGHWT